MNYDRALTWIYFESFMEKAQQTRENYGDLSIVLCVDTFALSQGSFYIFTQMVISFSHIFPSTELCFNIMFVLHTLF